MTSVPVSGFALTRSRVNRRWVVLVLGVVLSVGAYRAGSGTAPFPSGLSLDVAGWLDGVNTWVVNNNNTSPIFLYGFNYLGNFLQQMDTGVLSALTGLGWIGFTVIAVLATARWVGGRLALGVLAACASFAVLGLWTDSMSTLSLVVVSVLIALAIGVPLGILAGRVDRVQAALSPVLDVMQILPSFAYLMPVVLFFQIGAPSAIICTVIYALPPVVRLTSVGIREVPRESVEASLSLGASPRQLLIKTLLPGARRLVLLGVNQTIMMALSMVIIASLVGAGGLGDRVYQGLSNVDIGAALEPGVAIVAMAMALDRVTERIGQTGTSRGLVAVGPLWWRRRRGAVSVLAVMVVAVLAGRGLGTDFPSGATFSIASPVDTALTWVSTHLAWLSTFSGWFILYFLHPITTALTMSPWWLVVAAGGFLAWWLGTWRTGLGVAAGLTSLGVIGMWNDSLTTLSQVVAGTVLTVVLGIMVGVAASRSDRWERAIRPVLDAMQTTPSFLYLIPTVALFGVGQTPGVIASVVFAVPVVIRVTSAALREVSPTAVEAARSAGASRRQLLWKVQMPLARRAIMVGVNQGIVMVLAMVIIGGLAGSGALGYDVVAALSRNHFGLGVVSGAAIVVIGVMLDRMTQSAARRGSAVEVAVER
ncbi:MAG: ABC transporter permease [Actinomycetes bacterium]